MTQIKKVLDSDTIPCVEIDFMNRTHFEEIALVNELGQLISAYQETTAPSEDEKEQITQLLKKWLEHTQAHFSRENDLMQEVQFPAYPVHSNEHEIVLKRMVEIVNVSETSKDIGLLADYVFTLWPEWFNRHVNSMDRMTAKFAVMNGYDPHQQPQDSK